MHAPVFSRERAHASVERKFVAVAFVLPSSSNASDAYVMHHSRSACVRVNKIAELLSRSNSIRFACVVAAN